MQDIQDYIGLKFGGFPPFLDIYEKRLTHMPPPRQLLNEVTPGPVVQGAANDPSVWLDRLAAIFRYWTFSFYSLLYSMVSKI